MLLTHWRHDMCRVHSNTERKKKNAPRSYLLIVSSLGNRILKANRDEVFLLGVEIHSDTEVWITLSMLNTAAGREINNMCGGEDETPCSINRFNITNVDVTKFGASFEDM